MPYFRRLKELRAASGHGPKPESCGGLPPPGGRRRQSEPVVVSRRPGSRLACLQAGLADRLIYNYLYLYNILIKYH